MAHNDLLLELRNLMSTFKQALRNLSFARFIKRIALTLPTHYSSPLPSFREIRNREKRLFEVMPHEIPGINLNNEEQLEIFHELKRYYPSLPFSDQKKEGLRYYYRNEMFSYSDAITFFGMIRHLKPKRILEVGSGFSSCLALDTNEQFFNSSIECTFIEPYPQRLISAINSSDLQNIHLIQKKLQDVDDQLFLSLEENDILFLDSTHVGKVGSDVNYFFFHILPKLRKGVYIQIHDVIFPFEYPKQWIYEGRVYNESYMLRTFLQYNTAFKIVYFNTYLTRFHRGMFEREMPLCLKNTGGSIWLKKVI